MKEIEKKVEHGEQAIAKEGNIVCSGKYQCLIIRLQRKKACHLLREAQIPNKKLFGCIVDA